MASDQEIRGSNPRVSMWACGLMDVTPACGAGACGFESLLARVPWLGMEDPAGLLSSRPREGAEGSNPSHGVMMSFADDIKQAANQVAKNSDSPYYTTSTACDFSTQFFYIEEPDNQVHLINEHAIVLNDSSLINCLACDYEEGDGLTLDPTPLEKKYLLGKVMSVADACDHSRLYEDYDEFSGKATSRTE